MSCSPQCAPEDLRRAPGGQSRTSASERRRGHHQEGEHPPCRPVQRRGRPLRSDPRRESVRARRAPRRLPRTAGSPRDCASPRPRDAHSLAQRGRPTLSACTRLRDDRDSEEHRHEEEGTREAAPRSRARDADVHRQSQPALPPRRRSPSPRRRERGLAPRRSPRAAPQGSPSRWWPASTRLSPVHPGHACRVACRDLSSGARGHRGVRAGQRGSRRRRVGDPPTAVLWCAPLVSLVGVARPAGDVSASRPAGENHGEHEVLRSAVTVIQVALADVSHLP